MVSLRDNQRGIIISLIINVAVIALLFILFNNYVLNRNDGDGENETNVIDQAKETKENVENTSQKANTILNGLTGN